MPRRPDPSRKPQLLAEILEHLLDKPLASVSFRTIAQALGVSTYTLVYHFGTRAQLLGDIVVAVSTDTEAAEDYLHSDAGTLDAYFDDLEKMWRKALEPRNRQLLRLEFEAALIESVDPGSHTLARGLFEQWHRVGQRALESAGLDPQEASLESRLLVDTLYGIQFDLVLNNDTDAATAAFEAVVSRHREQVESRVDRDRVA